MSYKALPLVRTPGEPLDRFRIFLGHLRGFELWNHHLELIFSEWIEVYESILQAHEVLLNEPYEKDEFEIQTNIHPHRYFQRQPRLID